MSLTQFLGIADDWTLFRNKLIRCSEIVTKGRLYASLKGQILIDQRHISHIEAVAGSSNLSVI